MKDLLQLDKKKKNKKAVSEIVSYTLLIVIAIGVSSLVYYFLQLQTPKEKTECKDGISMGIDYAALNCDASKNPKSLNLTLLNNGRFKVNAAYVRLGEEGKSTRYWINDPAVKGEDKFFLSSLDSPPNSGLMPGKSSIIKTHTIPFAVSSSTILEIEPAILSEQTGRLAACENAMIAQKISCT